MFELIGNVVLWLVGLIASFYIPVILTMLRPGGLEVIALSMYSGIVGVALYITVSLIYFAAT